MQHASHATSLSIQSQHLDRLGQPVVDALERRRVEHVADDRRSAARRAAAAAAAAAARRSDAQRVVLAAASAIAHQRRWRLLLLARLLGERGEVLEAREQRAEDVPGGER